MSTMEVTVDNREFVVQGLLFGNEDEGAVACPHCMFTFKLPLDWWGERIGDRVSCPKCACVSQLPRPEGI